MNDVHELAANFTIALLLMHVLAALNHHFINRDDVPLTHITPPEIVIHRIAYHGLTCNSVFGRDGVEDEVGEII